MSENGGQSWLLPRAPETLFPACLFQLWRHLCSLAHGPSSTFSLSDTDPPAYLSRGPCNDAGPTRICQDHLPILRPLA